MHKPALPVTAASDGFLLFNSSMKPIFISPIAAQILTYPQKVETEEQLAKHVNEKLRAVLSSERPSDGIRLLSGRRVYLCRSFEVTSSRSGAFQASMAVLLERASRRQTPIADVSTKFNLTPRESGVLRFVLQGLTSKEIGVRMGISPNTVKSFLRLIMMKMGVSTRSGIVGKAFSPDTFPTAAVGQPTEQLTRVSSEKFIPG